MPGMQNTRLEYRKLCAILDETKDRKRPLCAEIFVDDVGPTLVISSKRPDRIRKAGDSDYKILAQSPIDLHRPDEAALAVARKLTLPGANPLEDG